MTQFDDFLKTQNLDWSRWRSLPAAQKAEVGIDFKLSLNKRPHDSDLKDANIPLSWDNNKIAQARSTQKRGMREGSSRLAKAGDASLKGRKQGLIEQKQEASDAEKRKRWLAIAKRNGINLAEPSNRATKSPMFKHTSDDWKIPPRHP